MVHAALHSFLIAAAAVVSASPLIPLPRAVTSLDQAATAEAQQRDDTATRAFSNVQITTSDGRCLFVDPLSGDFRENLTPIQVAACGSTDGQGWDVITAGKHNNVANSALIVSTLTQACFNFDPRRATGNQVLLFSCGGRADGGGVVTNSQLFTFNGGAGPLALQPESQAGSCFTIKGNVVDIAACNAKDPNQSFTFGAAAAAGGTATNTATGAAASGAGAASGGAAADAGAGNTDTTIGTSTDSNGNTNTGAGAGAVAAGAGAGTTNAGTGNATGNTGNAAQTSDNNQGGKKQGNQRGKNRGGKKNNGKGNNRGGQANNQAGGSSFGFPTGRQFGGPVGNRSSATGSPIRRFPSFVSGRGGNGRH